MSHLPRLPGTRVLGAAALLVALVVSTGATVHADGGGPFPEPAPTTEQATPEPDTDQEPAPKDSESPATTPSPTPDLTASPTSSPAASPVRPTTTTGPSPGSTVRPPPLPADPAKDNLTPDTPSNPWFTWALVAAAALLALGGVLVAAALVRRRGEGAASSESPSPPAPQADPWAGLSTADREAFERAARDFGWN